MSLTDDDINAIAHLARLQIDPADLPRYSKDLSSILDLLLVGPRSRPEEPVTVPCRDRRSCPGWATTTRRAIRRGRSQRTP